MALKSTICKAALRIANVDSHYYRDHVLTLARHPSETDERMMLRILAFALHADDALQSPVVCADAPADSAPVIEIHAARRG